MFPSVIEERIYIDETTVGDVRASHLGSGSTYWVPKNLPDSGKELLDSTLTGDKCEVISYFFSGHGEGNFISNLRFYISDKNAVADDMEFYMRTTNDFTSPSDYTGDDIYDNTEFSIVPDSLPEEPNVGYKTDFTSSDDPTETEFIYFSPCIVSTGVTGTASWLNRLVFQYT